MASLVFCDVARFDDEICLQFRNDPGKRTFMERSLPVFIDTNVKRISERLLPGEIPKSDRDMDIIELVIKSVKEYMVLYRRDKIIDIPPSFVHQVPEKLLPAHSGQWYNFHSVHAALSLRSTSGANMPACGSRYRQPRRRLRSALYLM